MAGQRVDKAEVNRRINTVYRLLIKGYSSEEVLQNIAQMPWKVSRRQAQYYLAAARGRIDAEAAIDRHERWNEVMARLRIMRREAKTIKEELGILREEAALAGLYPPKSVMVTTWQDEVVDLLRKGQIAPADVRAAFPDLAAEFFARAGVRVGVDD